MPAPKVRRSVAMASTRCAVGEKHSARSNKPLWSKVVDGLRLDVWRNRYWKDRKDGFGYRSIHFQIATSDDALASGHFVEWTAPAISYLNDFFCAADAQSQEDHNSADILMSAWGDDESPFNYGTMIRFERLIIKSARHSPGIWSLISDLIRREFARRGSLMMLKAFPLEYEGALAPDASAASRQRFRRRKAMKRLYSRRLGVSAVPGPYGNDGWMWRSLKYCPKPRAFKRERP
jgi:hypothetical protein